MDNVVVRYDLGALKFDGLVEIEGGDSGPSSQGGDSGALIVDGDRRAVALLFAGSDQGGSNGQGVTFANPIRAVLDALRVDPFFSRVDHPGRGLHRGRRDGQDEEEIQPTGLDE
jgi:hypothetical protein